jgi:glycosyltransferase involved in cell wall biosynthesis
VKVLHLTVVRQLTAGQWKQLGYECAASDQIKDFEWHTLAYHNGLSDKNHIKKLPLGFRSLFTRKLWMWLVILSASKRYDFLIVRHMTFDPFSFLFAWLVKNRVGVHHAKEVEELRLIRRGWRGKVASLFEVLSGRFAVRNERLILGVTKEIAEYERSTHAAQKKIAVFPNGVNLDEIEPLADARIKNAVHVAFVCNTFNPWHGLDILIDAVQNHCFCGSELEINIHLIGRLSAEHLKQLSLLHGPGKDVFRQYGFLNEKSYRSILQMCDFGLASLAMSRQNLNEGSTLKVREMLAMGLPVYSTHKDVALEENHSFVRVVPTPTVSDMINFGSLCKNISRCEVRRKTQAKVSKEGSMRSVIHSLLELQKVS